MLRSQHPVRWSIIFNRCQSQDHILMAERNFITSLLLTKSHNLHQGLSGLQLADQLLCPPDCKTHARQSRITCVRSRNNPVAPQPEVLDAPDFRMLVDNRVINRLTSTGGALILLVAIRKREYGRGFNIRKRGVQDREP
jgi:hypothetical protein